MRPLAARIQAVFRLRAIVVLALLASPAWGQAPWGPRVRAVGELLLAQQTPHGCIPDVPLGLRAHQDGAMARTLLALGYAYRATMQVGFRNGFREGLRWMGACMEKKDRRWTGTWRHAYAARPPYVALSTSPDGIAEDARGMSSASALFVYLLALHTHLTDDPTVANAHRRHVRAALDFILEHNRGPNDLFYSGWHQAKGAIDWKLCRKQYASDQADVYLGLQAGHWLLGLPRYKVAAEKLYRRFPRALHDRRTGAFGIALDEQGKLLPASDTCESYFTQGYLAWAFGPMKETEDGMKWLHERLAPDGTIRRKKADTPYILPLAAFCMGSSRLGLYPLEVRRAKRFLREIAMTPQGGIREAAERDATTRNDLAGWVVSAWLSVRPRPFGRQPAVPGGP